VRVAMLKVPGVESVRISLRYATTTLELSDDNTVTLDQLREIIKKNGFTSGEAQITATGTLTGDGDLIIDLAPAKASLTINSKLGSDAASEARKLASGGPIAVDVTGIVDRANVLALKDIKRKGP
jgi:hypothetical protein